MPAAKGQASRQRVNAPDSRIKEALYRGRLSSKLAPEIRGFISSLPEDLEIAPADIAVNQVHSLLLKKAGILTEADLSQILKGLQAAEKELARLRKDWPPEEIQTDFVDIHPWIESFVIQRCGLRVGGKLHLAKSRNDQVMTDVRMVAREKILEIASGLLELISRLLARAGKEKLTFFPAYTHTQPAQVTSYAHYLLACTQALLRDSDRLSDSYARLNLLPLGAGATAGSRIKLDRNLSARYLGFSGTLENSTDAVSSRDLFIELGAGLLSLSVSLSRIAADCIFWMTPGIGMVELPDQYADTSSALPQKKNPDPLEMVRAQAHLVQGLFSPLVSVPAGLPTGYHKDFQALKKNLFGIFAEVKVSLSVMSEILPALILHRNRMIELSQKSGLAALDLAEALGETGQLPFREAHRLIGQLVREAQKRGVELDQARAEWVRGLSPVLKRAGISSLARFLSPSRLLHQRISRGGPSPPEVARMIREQKAWLRTSREKWQKRRSALNQSRQLLKSRIQRSI